jgi:SOS-response transcriptional repressor LexA
MRIGGQPASSSSRAQRRRPQTASPRPSPGSASSSRTSPGGPAIRPATREIASALGLTSLSSVSLHVRTLQKKGYLDRDVGRPRTAEAAAARRDDLIGRLARRRAASGLSQADVAGLMGTSQSVVTRLEAGQSDTQLSTLIKYAEALGVSLDFTECAASPLRTYCREDLSGETVPEGQDSAGTPARSGAVPAEVPDRPDPDHVLTWRQRKLLQVIRDSVQRRGYPPSMREIAEAVGLASTSSVSSAEWPRRVKARGLCLPESQGSRPLGPWRRLSLPPLTQASDQIHRDQPATLDQIQ